MRVVITGGQGVGQYGKISTYNSGAKLANVLKMTVQQVGNTYVQEHPSSSMQVLIYLIEPNVEFTAPY